MELYLDGVSARSPVDDFGNLWISLDDLFDACNILELGPSDLKRKYKFHVSFFEFDVRSCPPFEGIVILHLWLTVPDCLSSRLLFNFLR